MKQTASAKTKNNKNSKTGLSLRKWNILMAIAYAVQGVAILLLSSPHLLPLNVSYLTADNLAAQASGHAVLATAVNMLTEVDLVAWIVLILFLSVVTHVLLATVYRRRYEHELNRGFSRLHQSEIYVSAGIILVVVGLLSGVYDVAVLFVLFILPVIAGLISLAWQARRSIEEPSGPDRLIGSAAYIAAVAPWLVILVYLIGANIYGGGNLPVFVYWVYATMLLFFASFAANVHLSYSRKGKLSGYIYGERGYMILVLAAESLLAWQVFFGALHP